jgi:hypothetical protein
MGPMKVQMRGHPVYWKGGWRYLDNDELVEESVERACVKCDQMPIPGHFDPCLSQLPDGVNWACCGHGVEDGYIRWGTEDNFTTDALIVTAVTNPNLPDEAVGYQAWEGHDPLLSGADRSYQWNTREVDVPLPHDPEVIIAHRTLWTDGHKRRYYIPIPKVGTNSLRTTFPDWKQGRATEGMEGFALIRNPVDRWFSGINEYLHNNTNPFNQEFLDGHLAPDVTKPQAWDYMMKLALEEGKFEWDDHTKNQAHYVYGYNAELVKFENAAAYIQETFNRTFPWKRQRDWSPVPVLTPFIVEHYAEDMALYEAAL